MGPRNIASISRLTGAHQETVRYKIKKRFAKLGFRFQAEVDYPRIGLGLHWATLRFSAPLEEIAPRILRLLNKYAYLTHFSKTIPQGYYVAIFAIPEGLEDEHRQFLERLRNKKFVQEIGIEEVVSESHRPMATDFFNFRPGTWEVEWGKVRNVEGTPLPTPKKHQTLQVDYQDLLLIKELQMDALQHVVGIAKKMKANPKALEYHYRNHVVGEKLISSYRTRWMQDVTKTLAHSVAFTRYTFKGLAPGEYTKVQGAVSKIPFLWAEDLLGDGTYIATLNVPLSELVQTNAYLNDEMAGLGTKVEVGYLKPNESSNFTIPHQMFDGKSWKFDARKAETALLRR